SARTRLIASYTRSGGAAIGSACRSWNCHSGANSSSRVCFCVTCDSKAGSRRPASAMHAPAAATISAPLRVGTPSRRIGLTQQIRPATRTMIPEYTTADPSMRGRPRFRGPTRGSALLEDALRQTDVDTVVRAIDELRDGDVAGHTDHLIRLMLRHV